MKKIIACCFFTFLSIIVIKAQTTELWGTNFRGGDDNQGRIVKVTAAGVVSQAHGFASVYPGRGESYLKPLNYNGFLYLLFSGGGKNDVGVLVKYDPTTNITTRLFDFDQTTGYTPFGCNLLVYNNKFYGMTQQGGANNLGTIYEYDPATNVCTKKFDFTATLGQPYVSRFEVFNDKFYACTSSGGANNFGTLFEYDPATNTCIKKLDLTNDGTIGRSCFSGMTLFNGKLYGSMRFIDNNNGCIFEYDPVTNIYVKKIILTATSIRDIDAKFISNGTVLYATSNQGDGQFGQGAIIEYNPTSNVLTTKIQFDFSTGAGSFGDLVLYNGKYYGTNTAGGANSYGALFEWDPISNTITNRKYLGNSLGENPYTGIEVFNNKLYTTTSAGDLSLGYNSTMVEWDVAANSISRKFIFKTGDGIQANTKLLYHDNKVYGTTPRGGNNFNGILFSKDVNTGTYTQLYQFASATFLGSGISPLSVYNNKIYGIANSGGASASGVGYIFEWDIATATFTNKMNLSNTTGNRVIGQMYLHTDNNFYGISQAGGTNSTGTIFKWNPATNVYTVLAIAPQNATGGFVASGSLLYVPTLQGGGGYGSVYAFNIATSTGVPVVSYNASLGTAVGEFALLNGILYTGTSDGSNSNGNIVAFNPNTNSLSIAKVLSPGFPVGAANIGNISNGMLAVYNNELYGFCSQGGLNGLGTTFKFNPLTNVFTKLEDNDALGGTTSTNGNGFVTITTAIVTPVKLLFFNAEKRNNNEAIVQWQTAQEQNNKGFEIEKSTDGISFEKIGWVQGEGNSNSLNSYSFIDKKTVIGKNYYRLQQVDIDNKKTTSAIKSVDFGKADNNVSIYPNPFVQSFSVQSNATLPSQLFIISADGKIVKQQIIIKGKNSVNLLGLPAGLYFYKIIYADGNVEKGKITKQ